MEEEEKDQPEVTFGCLFQIWRPVCLTSTWTEFWQWRLCQLELKTSPRNIIDINATHYPSIIQPSIHHLASIHSSTHLSTHPSIHLLESGVGTETGTKTEPPLDLMWTPPWENLHRNRKCVFLSSVGRNDFLFAKTRTWQLIHGLVRRHICHSSTFSVFISWLCCNITCDDARLRWAPSHCLFKDWHWPATVKLLMKPVGINDLRPNCNRPILFHLTLTAVDVRVEVTIKIHLLKRVLLFYVSCRWHVTTIRLCEW